MNQDPRNPFNWRMRTEPSIFARDQYFKPKQSKMSQEDRESQLINYKQFGVFSKAQPGKLENKHEG
jgi:hypothetical protein